MPRFTTGESVRAACRRGELIGQTSGLAPGFAQANLVILPRDWADEFLLFCQRNPKPCPLLEVLDPGDPVPRVVVRSGKIRNPKSETRNPKETQSTESEIPKRADTGDLDIRNSELELPSDFGFRGSDFETADIRTDLPMYRVWRNGELAEELADVTALWRDDFVTFLIGCSFTFEAALLRAGVPVRHIDLGVNVPMFRTNIPCVPAGRFHGPLVVSMRPITPADAIRAVQITSRYPSVHGAPVHLGLPERIGIADVSQPDFGDPVPVRDGELPVFWACGTTPQAALMQAKPPLAITHSPGCMFVTDVSDESLAVG
jgi:uncharacterized protein YcsI (UPF0317 family)